MGARPEPLRYPLSRQLTVNYQRTLYVLEKTDSARATMGKYVMLYEDDAGKVTIRTEAGGELRAEAFDRVPRARIQPGDVVDNKHVAAGSGPPPRHRAR